MRRDGYELFSEGRIGTMTLKNRLVRSATQGDRRAIQNGRLDALLARYRDLAAGGVGLIISGSTLGLSVASRIDLSKLHGWWHVKLL